MEVCMKERDFFFSQWRLQCDLEAERRKIKDEERHEVESWHLEA